MSLVDINWRPNHKELRNFAIAALIASAVISLLLYVLKGLAIHWAAIIFAAGFIIFLSSLVSTKITRIIYLGLILVTFPIGYVVSFILLSSFYFLLLTPLGLLFRLIGRDPLCRKFDSNVKSYWLIRKSPKNLDRYFHQF
jgi:zinc transporter ZupT